MNDTTKEVTAIEAGLAALEYGAACRASGSALYAMRYATATTVQHLSDRLEEARKCEDVASIEALDLINKLAGTE